MSAPSSPKSEPREIELAKVIRDGVFQYRTDKDGKEIESLKTSIRADGQLQPVIVRVLHDGRHQLVSGFRRTAAMLALGMKTVKAEVWPDMSDEQAMRVAIAENIVRESLSEWDKVRTALRLRDSGMKKLTVADAFNVKVRTLERWCFVAKAPEDFQKALSESKLTIQAAYTALQNGLSLKEILGNDGRGRSVRFLQQLSRNKNKKHSHKTLWKEGRDGSFTFSLRYQPGQQDIPTLTKEVEQLLQKLQSLNK